MKLYSVYSAIVLPIKYSLLHIALTQIAYIASGDHSVILYKTTNIIVMKLILVMHKCRDVWSDLIQRVICPVYTVQLSMTIDPTFLSSTFIFIQFPVRYTSNCFTVRIYSLGKRPQTVMLVIFALVLSCPEQIHQSRCWSAIIQFITFTHKTILILYNCDTTDNI